MTPARQFVLIRLRLLRRALGQALALVGDLIKIALAGFDGI